jgi:predicted component of type VI protein secretion system
MPISTQLKFIEHIQKQGSVKATSFFSALHDGAPFNSKATVDLPASSYTRAVVFIIIL